MERPGRGGFGRRSSGVRTWPALGGGGRGVDATVHRAGTCACPARRPADGRGGARAVNRRPAGDPQIRRRRRPGLRQRLPGRTLLRAGLARDRRDGRRLVAAAEARRRRLVRRRRRLARARDEVHERMGLHADGVPRRRRPAGQPHRVRAGRRARRALRAAAAQPRPGGEDRARQGRRALRAHVALPVGVDDAERRRFQPPGHGRLRTGRARLPRRRDAAPQRRAARLGRGRRFHAGPRWRHGRPRPLGRAGRAGAVRVREPVLVRRGPVRQGYRWSTALRAHDPCAR